MTQQVPPFKIHLEIYRTQAVCSLQSCPRKISPFTKPKLSATGTSTANGASDTLLWYPQPAFQERSHQPISISSVQGSPVDLICFWFAGAWRWAVSNACTHQLAEPSPTCQRNHVCNWSRVSKQGKTSKKKPPTYLQVFRLTWLNVSALSRGGMALGTAPADRSEWWQPSRGDMSGRKGLVPEALHSSCAGSSVTRWTQPLGSDGAKTSSMFQLILAHHRCSSTHLSLSSSLSPQDHHTRTEHTHSWSALSTGIRAIHIGRKNNRPFSFFIHMDEELVQLTLLWKNRVFSEECWFCF